MKKKLILIFPIDKSYIKYNSYTPPLALGILAALTPDNWDVEIIDESWGNFEYKDADLVGVTSWTFNINRAYEIAAKYVKNEIPVVMGGIHVSALPEEAIKYCNSVVVGLAEEIWPILINDFENGRLKSIYKGSPTDKFVKPRRDLFDKRYCMDVIQTSRGCPMNCNFCSAKQFSGEKYIKKPIDEIFDDIRALNHKFVFIVDENILGHSKNDEKQTLELFSRMAELKNKIFWFGFSTINIAMNDILLAKAAQSGCGLLYIGIEAEDDKTLLLMNKRINILDKTATLNQLVEKIHKVKIGVLASLIYCAESDTIASIEKRAEFINKSTFDAIHSGILTPFPGTKIFKEYQDLDRLCYENFPEDWKHYNLKSITIKPDYDIDFSLYSSIVKKNILKPYNPVRILFRAIKTYTRTQNIIITLNCFSVNIKYRNYFLNKTDSKLLRFHDFLNNILGENWK